MTGSVVLSDSDDDSQQQRIEIKTLQEALERTRAEYKEAKQRFMQLEEINKSLEQALLAAREQVLNTLKITGHAPYNRSGTT
jgi:ATP:corrinoid adenosyltransferase